MGVFLFEGENIVFLIYDVLLVDKNWLYYLVIILENFFNAVGIFGKYLLYFDVDVFIKWDLENYF